MTPSDAQKLLPIIKAHSEGAQIQLRRSDGVWINLGGDIGLGYPPECYRIAPAKVRVKGWLNVYPYGLEILHVRGLHATRTDADREASHDRIACIEIDVEGERLG